MRALLIAALLLPVAALAGCTSTHAPPPHAARDDFVTIPHPVNDVPYQPCLGFVGNADLAGAAVDLPTGESQSFSAFDAGAHLVVPQNVSAIILDLSWDGGAATAIRSVATDPQGGVTRSDGRMQASGDNPIRLRFDNPEPGKWEWQGVADPVAAGVILHFNEGLYYETPEAVSFFCNPAGPQPGGP